MHKLFFANVKFIETSQSSGHGNGTSIESASRDGVYTGDDAAIGVRRRLVQNGTNGVSADSDIRQGHRQLRTRVGIVLLSFIAGEQGAQRESFALFGQASQQIENDRKNERASAGKHEEMAQHLRCARTNHGASL